MKFNEIAIEELQFNPFSKIGDDWMLITAGDESGYNTMTASWGMLGSLWRNPTGNSHRGLDVVTIFVRPQRYTKKFVDNNDYLTITFYDKSIQRKLGYLGNHSGRDEDKVGKMELTVDFSENAPYFQQANLVFVCRKLYQAPLLENQFIDSDVVESSYPMRDFHDMYVCVIEKVLVKEGENKR